MAELDDDDDDLSPRVKGESSDNLQLVRHQVQTNATRLVQLEKKCEDLEDVQSRLVQFARRRKKQWRNYPFYTKVLYDEMHKS